MSLLLQSYIYIFDIIIANSLWNRYKHGVIRPLIEPSLLRAVRNEIQEHLSFTEKETDIYKIFQSGDLANLDGLDDASLQKLPSLLKLRDAMYSARFREYLSSITGSGKLSGSKTDMAINIYTEGCHLLCHDDVIGSRRISYILYLTDPDTPWQPEWGGALRLYPTTTEKDENDEDVKVPSPDYSLSIPPSFDQLSFFAVQPGESFHDVEEVYHPKNGEDKSKKRVRMAISGWFHIPQKGEDGYEEGLEEKLAEHSSLTQLQARDTFDRPQQKPVAYEDETEQQDNGKEKGKEVEKAEEAPYSESDLNFLVQYIAPSYLTPDIAEQLSEMFSNECSLNLEHFLTAKFASRLHGYIEEQERQELSKSSSDIESKTEWRVAGPPHKHRYLYQQPSPVEADKKTPVQELLNDLLPSQAFRKWLSTVTGQDHLTSHNLLARRFRRGEDYTLASGYDGEEPRLEFTLCLTPTRGWGEDDDNGDEEDAGEGNNESSETNCQGENGEAKEKTQTKENGESSAEVGNKKGEQSEEKETKENGESRVDPPVGGYEVYMAGDDDDEEKEGEKDGKDGEDKNGKADPAVYRAAGADEDDGILFTTAASWNRMSIVLRDRGTLRFVKYVSEAAQGDRWDITGEIGVDFEDVDLDDTEEDEEDDEGEEEE